MKICNMSSVPTTDVEDLVRFAERHSRFARLAVLGMVDGTYQGTEGKAWRDQVHLRLRPPGLFRPFRTEWVPQVRVEILTWQEEFLFVLAHELRHVDQRWLKTPRNTARLEVDAERHAAAVLEEWRARNAVAETRQRRAA